jgi:hypothetical protein
MPGAISNSVTVAMVGRGRRYDSVAVTTVGRGRQQRRMMAWHGSSHGRRLTDKEEQGGQGTWFVLGASNLLLPRFARKKKGKGNNKWKKKKEEETRKVKTA